MGRLEKTSQESDSKGLSRFMRLLNGLIRNVTFALYLSFIVLGFGQVIFRYVLNRPVTWAEGLSRYLFVWSVFLGSALVMGEHIALKFFTDSLSPGLKRCLELVTNLIILGLIGWLFIFDGFRILRIVHNQLSPAMGVRMSFPYLSLLVGGILMILNLLWYMTTQYQARHLSKGNTE